MKLAKAAIFIEGTSIPGICTRRDLPVTASRRVAGKLVFEAVLAHRSARARWRMIRQAAPTQAPVSDSPLRYIGFADATSIRNPTGLRAPLFARTPRLTVNAATSRRPHAYFTAHRAVDAELRWKWQNSVNICRETFIFYRHNEISY
ncbi:hypothetical protein [Paraburkholderia sp.]|uniref:hypothetical protein n=1 Tax=Paraburkholderia sp. TaxID=1926495 RepID=UPI002F40A4B1